MAQRRCARRREPFLPGCGLTAGCRSLLGSRGDLTVTLERLPALYYYPSESCRADKISACDENAVAFPSPDGAKVVSQGRQPLDPESRFPFSQAPAGATVGGRRRVPCRTVLSPLSGPAVAGFPWPRGLRPWLMTGAPTGAICPLPRAAAPTPVLRSACSNPQFAICNPQSRRFGCGRRPR